MASPRRGLTSPTQQQQQSPSASTSAAVAVQSPPQAQRRISGLPKRAIQEQQAHAQQLLDSAKKLLERERGQDQQGDGQDDDRTPERILQQEEDQISQ